MYNSRVLKQISLILLSCLILTGCPLDGDTGKSGTIGVDGINCWDTNSNGSNDPEEDINGDEEWGGEDCLTPTPTPTAQNPDVVLNHQHICEALANLGEYPDGCPSAVHTKPAGTLREIRFMLDDGTGQAATSCDFAPNNGILSLEAKGAQVYWRLEGGFIASTTIIDGQDELINNSCMSLCQSDPKCVASLANSKDVDKNIIYECNLFHHSDTVQAWEAVCGTNFPDCAAVTGALSLDQRWSATCP